MFDQNRRLIGYKVIANSELITLCFFKKLLNSIFSKMTTLYNCQSETDKHQLGKGKQTGNDSFAQE